MDHGHYSYNNKTYYSKEHVLDDMILNKDFNLNIEFHYNEHIFNKLNWESPISTSLSTLYNYRAQQLRDKYKYLVLLFSGGSDSTQILLTFLKNNIFLDEIQIYHHEKSISRLDRESMIKDDTMSQFLEYELAAIPMLKLVKELSPNTKITTIDLSNYLVDQITNNKFEYMGNNSNLMLNISGLFQKIPRSFEYYFLKYNDKNITKDSVGIIRGIEKPSLTVINNILYFSFYDITMFGTYNFYLNRCDKSFQIEDFFWTKDMPFIPIKQSQVIKQELENNKEYYSLFNTLLKEIESFHKDSKNNLLFSPAYILARTYSKLLYPDWNLNTFSGSKPTKEIPEFKLLDILYGKHKGFDHLVDFRDFKFKKYKKINNKKQFTSFIFTRPHCLGQLNLKFL